MSYSANNTLSTHLGYYEHCSEHFIQAASAGDLLQSDMDQFSYPSIRTIQNVVHKAIGCECHADVVYSL